MPKGVYPHTHIKPRVYPPEIISLVQALYLDKGLTVREVQEQLPKGYKAQRIIERHIPERRRAIKRNQRGMNNDAWKGDEAGYSAIHLRARAELGPARGHTCHDCPRRADEWSYQGGSPDERITERGPYSTDLSYYAPRCRSCHRSYDWWKYRKKVMPNV